MIVIYDFDGTLTPYPLPKYETFHKCGITEFEGALRGKKIMEEENLSLYEAYFVAYRRYLEENNLPFNRESVCLGADNVTLNKGVLEYFQTLCSEKTGIKHYVVTAGFEEYIRDTPVFPYLDDVYGSTFTEVDGIYDEIDVLMNDENKVDTIKEIEKLNNVSTSDIVYFGDGLTDKDAFMYVHNNGGKSVLLSNSRESKEYQYFENLGIIDECFGLDFSVDSELYNYIKSLGCIKKF